MNTVSELLTDLFLMSLTVPGLCYGMLVLGRCALRLALVVTCFTAFKGTSWISTANHHGHMNPQMKHIISK